MKPQDTAQLPETAAADGPGHADSIAGRSPAEKRLMAENHDLRARLEAAEETLRAIRANEIDALVITRGDGEQISTIGGADQAYRTFVEVMCQGAATVAADGTILYCNRHFSELLRSPAEKTTGSSIYE